MGLTARNFANHLILIILCFCAHDTLAQELKYDLDKQYISRYGDGSELGGLTPLMKVDGGRIFDKLKSEEIKSLPKSVNKHQLAYGFLYFTGLNSSVIENKVTILVDDYLSSSPKIYIDRNGNLDFTDDDSPLTFKSDLLINLHNEAKIFSALHYRLGRSKVSTKNAERLRKVYAAKYPKSTLIPATHWITHQRLSVRRSLHKLSDKDITILLFDGSADGLFTFQTNDLGDRILILEGIHNPSLDLSQLLRSAQPIDHNAVFELYGNKYHIKSLSITGNELIVAATDKDTRVVFQEGSDISQFRFDLIDGTTASVKALLKDKAYLIIDVGGTWCRGCLDQEPVIKELYEHNKANVIGLFDYDTEQTVNRYINTHQINWPVALVNKSFKEKFGVTSFPSYFVVSSKGVIVFADMQAEKVKRYLTQVK